MLALIALLVFGIGGFIAWQVIKARRVILANRAPKLSYRTSSGSRRIQGHRR